MVSRCGVISRAREGHTSWRSLVWNQSAAHCSVSFGWSRETSRLSSLRMSVQAGLDMLGEDEGMVE